MKLVRRFSTTLNVMTVAILASGFIGNMADAFGDKAETLHVQTNTVYEASAGVE